MQLGSQSCPKRTNTTRSSSARIAWSTLKVMQNCIFQFKFNLCIKKGKYVPASHCSNGEAYTTWLMANVLLLFLLELINWYNHQLIISRSQRMVCWFLKIVLIYQIKKLILLRMSHLYHIWLYGDFAIQRIHSVAFWILTTYLQPTAYSLYVLTYRNADTETGNG
jgi:hypothetical protein